MKKTTKQVAKIIVEEGLEYAILGCLSVDNILDNELSRLWNQAYKALVEIDKYMDSQLGEGWDEGNDE